MKAFSYFCPRNRVPMESVAGTDRGDARETSLIDLRLSALLCCDCPCSSSSLTWGFLWRLLRRPESVLGVDGVLLGVGDTARFRVFVDGGLMSIFSERSLSSGGACCSCSTCSASILIGSHSKSWSFDAGSSGLSKTLSSYLSTRENINKHLSSCKVLQYAKMINHFIEGESRWIAGLIQTFPKKKVEDTFG